MSQLPLRAIEAFVMAARGRSLARAATTLNITVPAVSRRVRILEQHLGVQLFERLPRGVALTPAGERYFGELGPAWTALEAAMAASRTSSPRLLRVSLIPTFATNWLLPRLARLHGSTASLDIDLETSADYVDLANREDIDCVIRLGRGPWPDLESDKFLTVEAYAVASPAFLSDSACVDTPHDLMRHVLIGSSHQPDFWPEWCRLVGGTFAPAGYRSYDNLQLVYEAAAAGLGIAIGLDPLVRPYLASGRLKRIEAGTATISRSFHIARRRGRLADRRFDRFRDWLFKEARTAA